MFRSLQQLPMSHLAASRGTGRVSTSVMASGPYLPRIEAAGVATRRSAPVVQFPGNFPELSLGARPRELVAPPSLAHIAPRGNGFPGELDTSKWPGGVCCIDTVEHAKWVVQRLLEHAREGCKVHAVDTEVERIDVKTQTPVGHGLVTCISIYCGPDADFGDGRTMVWADFTKDGVRRVFKEYLESEEVPKVWHNYGFDRHVLGNHHDPELRIFCRGFEADTMHMARLWNSSRQGKGYSLESLSTDVDIIVRELGPDMAMFQQLDGLFEGKVGMRELFGELKRRKDGTEGKIRSMPDVRRLQDDPQTRREWIKYSAKDAVATWLLRRALEAKLRNMKVKACNYIGLERRTGKEAPGTLRGKVKEFVPCATMWQLYEEYWRPFGELLTDMEQEGMRADRKNLFDAEKEASEHQKRNEEEFRGWVRKRLLLKGATEEEARAADLMNIGSGLQIRHLLFDLDTAVSTGPAPKPKARAGAEPSRPPTNAQVKIKAGAAAADAGAAAAGAEVGAEAVPAAPGAPPAPLPGKEFKAESQEWLDWKAKGERGEEREKKAPKKTVPFRLQCIANKRLEPKNRTATGLPSVNMLTLREMCGKPGRARESLEKYRELVAAGDAEAAAKHMAGAGGACGSAYDAFGGGEDGLEACAAIDALCETAAIEKLLSGFIVPLQKPNVRAGTDLTGKTDDRVHCSLNINTETGRLSARRPNLQNQPALEKDRYGIRKSFTCKEENLLVVADYGQLELRLLAHMCECRSMIEAFELGGDFHSRTALGMFPHIQKAIAAKECFLEESEREPGSTAPLLKDKFASERRKAKILNFSIAYGKTAHGLAKDFGVTLEEAKATVEAWYSARQEVREWQDTQHRLAKSEGVVYTLLGRQRKLPDARTGDRVSMGHALRAAINTPIQGGAADIAMLAMLQLRNSELLKQLGFKLLMQIHDEVILEGPKENAKEALQEVVRCMEKPFDGETKMLLVDLVVDAKFAQSWAAAK